MTVIHAIHSNRFTQIDNDILRDERLSFRAHGLHSYLLTFPPDWHFDLNWIADRVKDGISAIRSALDELINFGYVRRVITRSPSGQFQSLRVDSPPLCGVKYKNERVHSQKS